MSKTHALVPSPVPARVSSKPDTSRRLLPQTLFHAGQPFSDQVAQDAVRGALPGRFPFGDRIAAETGGAVNPHQIPATTVSQLPGLGVCHGGKVALREGAGIDVARHELAHALGGDEATADQAGRDPSVLTSLSGPPVNGWKIGFEFQTIGAGNPKVHRKMPNQYWSPHPCRATARRLQKHQSWELVQDETDIEVVTEAVDETPLGERRLDVIMASVSREMRRIQDGGANGNFVNFTVTGEARPLGVKHDKGGSPFTAHPQATAGVHVEAIESLMSALTAQEPERQGRWGRNEPTWSDEQIGWGHTSRDFKSARSGDGRLDVRRSLGRISGALGDDADKPQYAKLNGLLNLIGSYIAIGKIQTEVTGNLKNLAPFMLRNNLHAVYMTLSPNERLRYLTLLASTDKVHSLAGAFGFSSRASLMAANLLKHGLGDNRPNINVGQFLTALPQRDLIAEADEHSIHQLNNQNVRQKMKGARSQFDIGKSELSPDRSGVFLELRALKRGIPWTQWGHYAALIHRLITRVNKQHEQRTQAQQRIQAQQRAQRHAGLMQALVQNAQQ